MLEYRQAEIPQRVSIIAEKSHTMNAGFLGTAAPTSLSDFQMQNRTELAKRVFGYPNWSKDGQYVYVLDSTGKGAVLRIRISDHKAEQVVDLKKFISVGSLRDLLGSHVRRFGFAAPRRRNSGCLSPRLGSALTARADCVRITGSGVIHTLQNAARHTFWVR